MDYYSNSDGAFSMDLARSVFPNVNFDSSTAGPSGPSAQPVFTHQRQQPQSAQSQGIQQNSAVSPPPANMQSETKEWLLAQGLSSDSITMLVKNGFTSKPSIAAMQREDIPQLGISLLGQQRALERAIATANSASEPSQQTSEDPARALQHLLGTGLQAPKQGERVDLEPLAYLAPKTATKYLDIVDFVSPVTPEVQEEKVMGDGDQVLVLKSGPKKPRLESITQMQWTAANTRILLELLQRGDLKHDKILEYMAYTVKIAELADAYIWSSVLLYDRAYRQLQAKHNFPWGSDSPHLVTVHLRQKQAVQGKLGVKMEICKKFNRNECTYGDRCRYRHVCSAPGCQQGHARVDHGRKTHTESKNSVMRD